MPIKLIVTLIVVSIFLICLITFFLIKGRIPEKYAILWYFFPLMIIIIAIFHRAFIKLTNFLGFKIMSNMLMSVIIGISLLLIMALTIMIAGQKKKTTLLIQEVSILKQRVKSLERNKK